MVYYKGCEKCLELVENYIKQELEGKIEKLFNSSLLKSQNVNSSQILYAVYSLLWKNQKINLKCEHNENGEIVKLLGVNDNSYIGHMVTNYDLLFGTNDERIDFYCNGDKKEYDEFKRYCILWENNSKFKCDENESNKLVDVLSEKDEQLKNRILKCEFLKRKAEFFKTKCGTLGNFIPMPSELSNAINQNFKNRFDLYLKQVQIFYKNNYEYKIEDYISKDFYNELKINEGYFKAFGFFENFINENYLDYYLDENGNVIELFKGEKGQVLPKNFKQILEYITKAEFLMSKRISRIKKYLFTMILQDKISKTIETNGNIMNNRIYFLYRFRFDLENHDIVKKIFEHSGKTYIFISDEETNDMIAMKNLINNKNLNLINILKKAKEIEIKYIVGDGYKYQEKKYFSSSFNHIKEYTKANFRTTFSNELQLKDKLQIMLIIWGKIN